MRVFALILTAMLFAPPTARADLAEELTGLLTEGWGVTQTHQSKAVDRYKAAYALAPNEADVFYALGLTTLHTGNYDVARKLLDRALSRRKGDLYLWRARFWLAMEQERYEEALAEMTRLAALLPDRQLDGDVETQLAETAAWMGRFFGYFAGPGFGKVPADKLSAAEKTVTDHLIESRRGAFDAGRKEVLDRFRTLQREISAQRRQDATDQVNLRRAAVAQRAAEREKLTSDLEKLKGEMAAAKSTVESEVAAIDEKLKPLAETIQRVQKLAQPIVKRIRELDKNFTWADLAKYRNKGKGRGKRGIFDDPNRDRINENLRQLEPIIKQYAKVQAEATRLAAAKSQLVSKYQAYFEKADIKRKQLERRLRKLDEEESETSDDADPMIVASEKLKSLISQATDVSTYQPFPLEAERKRLLKKYAR